MTRNEALEIARVNHTKYRKATVDHLFGRTQVEPKNEDYGYRHGWFTVGEFCFSTDEITGQPYDHAQGGWAYL